MTNRIRIAASALQCAIVFISSSALSQTFSSGSTGTESLLVVGGTTNTLALPPDGILQFKRVTIRSNAVLRFTRNALNTPVFILSSEDVTVDGLIDVSGAEPEKPMAGGQPGPGGFSGGAEGYLYTGAKGGAGLGPGGGKPGQPGEYIRSGYGHPHLIPIIGGSGGGGGTAANAGGGGGGGAILIASSTRIQLNASGAIIAEGGVAGGSSGGSGSGGAIRLVAPTVLGTGALRIAGPIANVPAGNHGRARVDSIYKYDPQDPTNRLAFRLPRWRTPTSGNQIDLISYSHGSTMIVFSSKSPKLTILDVGGIAVTQNPTAPITLGFGNDPNVKVRIRAEGFGSIVPVTLAMTLENGERQLFAAEVDNSSGTSLGDSIVEIPIVLPVNQRVFLHVWKTFP